MRMCTRGHQTMVTETSTMINFWGRFVYNMVINWIAILFIGITFFCWQVFLWVKATRDAFRKYVTGFEKSHLRRTIINL